MSNNLYNDNHPLTSLNGTGFKNAIIANNTIKLVKKRSLKYQFDVINTMYNRAKYHPNKTKDMIDAMKIFKSWLKSYKKLKEKELDYSFLSLSIIKKYEKLIDEYGINNKYNFLKIYKKIKSPYKLQYVLINKNKPSGYDYYSFRNYYIKSKLKKLNKLFYEKGKYKGLPTKNHLKLIMFAYSPVDL